MKKLIVLAAVIVLQGCLTIPTTSESRISTDLSISQYNSISGRYMETKAFASITSFPDGGGQEFIYYKADKYGTGQLWIAVPKSEVSNVVIGLNKYLKWNDQAKANQDVFQKDIMTFKAPSSDSNYYKVEFYSGNAQRHFALFYSCMTGLTGPSCAQIASLNENNVHVLINELSKYSSGTLSASGIASKYN